MKLRVLMIGVAIAAGVGYVRAQDAQAEKTIIANERAVNDAVAKGTVAGFKQHVAADGWAIDPMTGRAPVADFIKDFAAMTKDMKITSWDITDSKVQWVDANTAVHSYKWTGKGTYQGQPVPSPTWASTVWTKKNGQWMAVFHQESIPPPAPPAK
jgi:hypothetical protein